MLPGNPIIKYMKQTLQLRLGQHLTMTPQLQQAIRLLQLSSLELQSEIQEVIDSNLMLESTEDGDHSNEMDDNTGAELQSEKLETTDDSLNLQNNEIPDDLPVDTAWEDIYDYLPTAGQQSATDYDNRDFEATDNRGESLHSMLNWQLNLTSFSDTDRLIAESIIDSINDDGYLTSSIDDIQQSLDAELDIEVDEIEAVLHRIQTFDPPGIAARDLQENLYIQMKLLADDGTNVKLALILLKQHFMLLAKRDYQQIIRRMKISEQQLKDIMKIIQTLNPRPGSQITDKKPEYIVPDILVKKINGVWKVELNKDNAPRLRINPQYASLIKNVRNSADNTYLKNHLQEARWFIKSLNSRNETLLKVAHSIVTRQRGFLEYGEEAMKAMVLHDIATEVDMHESTISRVTTKKYMHTPRGIFELKYFFSSHVTTSTGGECSATAIRALIKKLIASEKIEKPLSDSKLAEILSDQGIKVARRTIAKYREALAIPPSNERKRLT